MQRFCVLCTTLLILLLTCAATAEAHASLVRSEPKAGSTLDHAPAMIVLEFSEELDPAFSRVQLFDGASRLFDPGPGLIDAQNPHILRLPVTALGNGTYTAIWRARSATDGHVTEGSVPFGVGVRVTATALIPPPGTPDPATVAPPLTSSLIRWLSLLGTLLMLGVFPFALFVWRPAYTTATNEPLDTVQVSSFHEADRQMARAGRVFVALGGIVLLVATILFLLDQAIQASGASFAAPSAGPSVTQLLLGRTGLLLSIRVGLTLTFLVLMNWLPRPGSGARWPWWLGLALGTILLATFSLNSHAAAESSNVVAIALDWLHLAAAVSWIGGLLPLAVAVWRARRSKAMTLPLRLLIPRFSLIAIISVIVLAGSGFYSYLLHIGSANLLLATTYGQALTFKLVLFGLLVLFGAWNLLVLSPGLRKANTKVARSFSRTLGVELVLGSLVLLAAGALTSVAPSKVAWAQQEQLGLVREINSPGVAMRLQVAPAQIGENEFAVDLRDERPDAAGKPAKLLLRFKMEGMDMGEVQTEMTPATNGRYTARGSYLSMGGRWRVELILRRAGFEDVRQELELDIVKATKP